MHDSGQGQRGGEFDLAPLTASLSKQGAFAYPTRGMKKILVAERSLPGARLTMRTCACFLRAGGHSVHFLPALSLDFFRRHFLSEIPK